MIVWTGKLLVQNCTSPHGGREMDSCTHVANHVQSFLDCNHLGGKRHASKLHMWEAENSICSPIVANKKPKVEKGKLTSHDILAWFEEAEGAESLWVLTNLDRTKFEEVFDKI